jgi:stringent starvation protein B
LRALHEWIVDNGATPQILVDALHEALEVPDNRCGPGSKLVLNISPRAVRDLEIDTEFVSFVARFSGVSHAVLVPVEAVLAIYARENGQGMMFPDSEDDDENATSAAARPRPVSGPVSSKPDTGKKEPDDDPDSPGPERKGKPNLKVIK